MNEWARTNKQQENIKLKTKRKKKKKGKTKTLQKIAIRVQWNSCLIAYQTKPDKQALTHRQLHNEKKTKFRQFSLQWKSFFAPRCLLGGKFSAYEHWHNEHKTKNTEKERKKMSTTIVESERRMWMKMWERANCFKMSSTMTIRTDLFLIFSALFLVHSCSRSVSLYLLAFRFATRFDAAAYAIFVWTLMKMFQSAALAMSLQHLQHEEWQYYVVLWSWHQFRLPPSSHFNYFVNFERVE